MSKVERAIRWMEQTAVDNSHGYSMANRWGPDYDCSSAVITAWEQAGVPVKSRGASYTGNMYNVFLQCGFQDVTHIVDRATGRGMMRGDVLLTHVSHTAMVTKPGEVVHARSSEGNSTQGDQSGAEFRIQSYWNYPWDAVLRYPDYEKGEEKNEEDTSIKDKPKETAYLHLEYGDGLNAPLRRVKALQVLLNEQDALEGQAYLDEDGEFGRITEMAVRRFQEHRGLEVNGIIDQLVWEELIKFEV